MKFSAKKKAFSLIELSIVILIIALVIGGVLEGKKLITESHLVSAQRLTLNSQIEKINDLVVWLETSLPESFDNILLDDGTAIATWHDRAVSNVNRHNATQTNTTNQPLFINHIINQTLPALQFSGNQWMSFANGDFNNSSYTIFVVEQRNSDAGNLYFISSGSSGANFFSGYASSSAMVFSHASTNLTFNNIADYDQAQPTVRIHTLVFKNNGEMQYYENGGANADANTSTGGSVLADNEIIIGASLTNVGNYSGYIAEVIMFKRNLLTEERRQIEGYLGKKYNIAIN